MKKLNHNVAKIKNPTTGKYEGLPAIVGKDGKDGVDGINGKDGVTPTIGENGNWYIGDEDTGKPSRGESTSNIIEFADGEMIVLSDSSDSNLKELKIYGKSTQYFTAGAQLFDYNILNVEPIYIGSGSNIGLFEISVPNGQYTASTNVQLVNSCAGTFIIPDNIPTSITTVNSGFSVDNPLTVTVTNNKLYLGLYTRDLGTNTYGHIFTKEEFEQGTYWIMLNSGATALKFEQYTGGLPSPNFEYPQQIASVGDKGTIEVKVFGKNFYDGNDMLSSKIVSESGYFITPIQFKKFILSLPINYTFTCSYSVIGGTTIGTNAGKIAFQNDAGTFLISAQNSFILTEELKRTIDKVILYGNVGDNITFTDIMINLGVNAIPYEPYKEQKLTLLTPNGLKGIQLDANIELATYKDKDVYWISDEIDLEKGQIIKRIANYTMSKADGFRFEDYGGENYKIVCKRHFADEFSFSKTRRCECNCSKGVHETNPQKNKAFICFFSNGFFYYYLGAGYRDVITTKEQVLEQIVGNDGIYLEYILETPVITQLTETEIKAYKALYSYYLNTNIVNDENAYMHLKYNADTKAYIDKKISELQTALANTQAQML